MRNVALGQKIRELREARGLSQDEFAALAGLHRTYISQVERGLKSPSLRTFFRLAQAVQTLPSEILRAVENQGVDD